MGTGKRIRPIHIPPGLSPPQAWTHQPLPTLSVVEVYLPYIINKVRLTKWHQSPWC